MRKPSREPGQAAPDQEFAEEQVLGYLAAHPEFLDKHAGDLARLLPEQQLGERVIDLQHYLVERMRRRAEALEGERDHLLSLARLNNKSQARVHRAVLALISAPDLERLVEAVTGDLPPLLGLDAANLCIEATEDVPTAGEAVGVRMLESGKIDELLGRERDMLLRRQSAGESELFGPAASLVRSDALMRLRISSLLPPGLLALGSRKPGRFQPGQGTELLSFLARVLEGAMRGWLELPR